MRQYFFHTTFILKLAIRGIISSSHAKNNLPNRRFSHEQFLTSKFSSILPVLSHLESHMLRFHI